MTLTSRKPVDVALKPLEAIAELPVFWNLEHKRVVVVGGTAAAAWRAELLAASGANVVVLSETIGTEMAVLLKRGAAAGRLVHHARPWATDIFDNAAMAIADAECNAQAKAFYCAAVLAGVPVNVINKPEYCQFKFGSIINRSPVIVAISTNGASSVFEQTIRRHIDTLLPLWLADWAQLAKTICNEVIERLHSSLQRQAFWEIFSDTALQRELTSVDSKILDGFVKKIPDKMRSGQGRVTLVGAGPGDVELLTIKAVRALQSADIILFDDLVPDDVLGFARREAKRMLVGKRGRQQSCLQEDINDLMAKLASQGNHVVRLKSGDPTIFGRGGEEIKRLEEENIPVDIIPGITAAAGLAATLGISLTHCNHAHSVRYVTGHSRTGELPEDLDWKGMVDPNTTLIFYMGGRTAPAIARKLLKKGMAANTDAVIARSISRPEMKIYKTTLTEMAANSAHWHESGPVLIAIGSVFARK